MKNRCYTYFRIVGQFNTDDISIILNLTPEKKWDIGDARPNGSKLDFANLNIIPLPFRNIQGIYYLYDYISSSNETLTNALMQANLELIKQKLDKIVVNTPVFTTILLLTIAVSNPQPTYLRGFSFLKNKMVNLVTVLKLR